MNQIKEKMYRERQAYSASRYDFFPDSVQAAAVLSKDYPATEFSTLLKRGVYSKPLGGTESSSLFSAAAIRIFKAHRCHLSYIPSENPLKNNGCIQLPFNGLQGFPDFLYSFIFFIIGISVNLWADNRIHIISVQWKDIISE